MSFWSITLISLVAGLIVVIGGALVIHMGSLVKNAYELKVEIQEDVENGLRRVEEETDKKSRWIKRDLIEEIEKSRTALATENSRRFSELADSLEHRLLAIEEMVKKNQAESVLAIEGLRRDIVILDQRLRGLKRDQKPPEPQGEATANIARPAAPDGFQDLPAALPAPSETPLASPKIVVPQPHKLPEV